MDRWANLLNAVGATLKPKVFCVGELADQGRPAIPTSASMLHIRCSGAVRGKDRRRNGVSWR